MNDQIIDAESKELNVTTGGDFMPALTLADAKVRYDEMRTFIRGQMEAGTDFGTIPGTEKDTLYKPGAEKLKTFFGLSTSFETEKQIENWEDESPFFYYLEKCRVYRGDTLIAEASGSANSKETKYRYRWVSEDQVPPQFLDQKDTLVKRGGKEGVFRWQYEKRETGGKYGKLELYWQKFDDALQDGTAREYQKEQHWKNNETAPYIEIESYQYRIPNDEVFTLVNTIKKMAQKRAFVAAILIAVNASDFFTQDVEDMADVIDVQVVEDDPLPKKEISWPADLVQEVIDCTPGEISKPEQAVEILNAFSKYGLTLTMDITERAINSYLDFQAEGLSKTQAMQSVSAAFKQKKE